MNVETVEVDLSQFSDEKAAPACAIEIGNGSWWTPRDPLIGLDEPRWSFIREESATISDKGRLTNQGGKVVVSLVPYLTAVPSPTAALMLASAVGGLARHFLSKKTPETPLLMQVFIGNPVEAVKNQNGDDVFRVWLGFAFQVPRDRKLRKV